MAPEPTNVDELETVSLSSSTSDDASWVGGYFSYGGHSAEDSTTIYFAIPPGGRLGHHVDTAEETQFIVGGGGDLLLDGETRPVRAGDVIVLTVGTAHDLHNTGTEDLRVIGFFSQRQVEQHWSSEVWEPGDLRVTGTPNRDGVVA